MVILINLFGLYKSWSRRRGILDWTIAAGYIAYGKRASETQSGQQTTIHLPSFTICRKRFSWRISYLWSYPIGWCNEGRVNAFLPRVLYVHPSDFQSAMMARDENSFFLGVNFTQCSRVCGIPDDYWIDWIRILLQNTWVKTGDVDHVSIHFKFLESFVLNR